MVQIHYNTDPAANYAWKLLSSLARHMHKDTQSDGDHLKINFAEVAQEGIITLGALASNLGLKAVSKSSFYALGENADDLDLCITDAEAGAVLRKISRLTGLTFIIKPCNASWEETTLTIEGRKNLATLAEHNVFYRNQDNWVSRKGTPRAEKSNGHFFS